MMQKTCLPDYNVLNTDICGLFFQFVHEEALACELAAYCYLELGDTEKAMHYFLLAHEKYHEWGAFGKCDSLFKFVQSILTPASTGAGVGRTTNTGNINDEWNRFLLGKRQDPPNSSSS